VAHSAQCAATASPAGADAAAGLGVTNAAIMARMDVIRDGPRRHEHWPQDLRRVRDSAFGLPRSSFVRRLTRARRYVDNSSRYPPRLCRLECWTTRVEDYEALVGYAWAYDVDGSGHLAYIDDVAVHADHQGRGVGTALIDEMVVWLRECGFRDITGLPTNETMARIFRRHEIFAWPRSCE
jgi:ribosomal protein S18 acetylase RimI-like enzyme